MFLLLLFLCTSAQVTEIQLDPNVKAHNTVQLNQWVFYSFTVPASEGFTLHVLHASKHDLDLYVSRAVTGLPSPTNYLYKDTDSAPNITIVGGAELQATKYVAGIYAFHGLRVPFSIEFKINNGCPGSCSGRGNCVMGVCDCKDGYVGIKCEYVNTELQTGQTYGPITATQDEWRYFSLPMYTQRTIQVTVTLQSGSVDSYVRPQQIPTSTSYFLVTPINRLGVTTFNITDPQLGTWYFGFWIASSSARFSFRVDESRLCQNDCSGPSHGACVGSSCRCTHDYYTSDCGTLRGTIQMGATYTGLATANAWNYYSVSADTANSIVVKVTNTEPKSQCEVYISPNHWPTLTNFTIHNVTSHTGDTSYTVITHPGFGDWKVGVYSSSRCAYSMVLSLDSSNNDCGCTVHGECVKGVCVCKRGFYGNRCEHAEGTLRNNDTMIGHIKKEEWHYYNFVALESSQLVFILQELSTTGSIWLFFAVGQLPTLQYYLVKEDNPLHIYHRISILFATPPTQNFPVTVGVYGSPSIPPGSSVRFKIAGFQTPF